MTQLRTNCPRCGEVELSAEEILLMSGEGIYRFICPECDETVDKTADSKIVSLLRSVGVEEYLGVLTEAEVEDFAAKVAGLKKYPGPLTESEVSDFVAKLARVSWLSELARDEGRAA